MKGDGIRCGVGSRASHPEKRGPRWFPVSLAKHLKEVRGHQPAPRGGSLPRAAFAQQACCPARMISGQNKQPGLLEVLHSHLRGAEKSPIAHIRNKSTALKDGFGGGWEVGR